MVAWRTTIESQDDGSRFAETIVRLLTCRYACRAG